MEILNYGKWPLLPDHITDDGSDYPTTQLPILIGNGIMSNNHLKGLLINFANVLGNPVSLIEFSPVMPYIPVITNSYSFSNDCSFDSIRDKKFNFIDLKNATITRSLIQENLDKNISDDTILLKKYINNRNIEKYYSIELLGGIRKVLTYNCPLLKQLEFYLPIIIENKTIAILHTTFINKDYVNEPDIIELNDIIQYFSLSDLESLKSLDAIKESKKYLTRDDNNTNKLYEFFGILESGVLYKRLEEKRISFITEENQKSLDLLRKEILSPPTIQDAKRFWHRVSPVLEVVSKSFPANHMIIFANTEISSDFPKRLNFSAYSHREVRKKYRGFYYNLNKIFQNGDIMFSNDVITSIEKPIICDYLYNENDEQIKLDPERDLIRIFPSVLCPPAILVIWVRYDERWPRLIEYDPNKKSNINFATAIASFYTFISSCYSSLLSNTWYKKLENAWRILGHETGHITSSIEWLRVNNLTEISRKKLTPERFDRLNINLEGLITHLNVLSKIAKNVIGGLPTLDKSKFMIFGQMLFKWRNIYWYELKSKSLNLILPKTYNDAFARPEIYADKALVESIIYNLINNAIKYCYLGTNVYIDAKRAYNKNRQGVEISIVNYGNKLSNNKNIYKLYSRGENTNGIEGLGIGLFLAEQIARAHEGTITHSCIEISKYSVSLMAALFTTYNDTAMHQQRISHEMLNDINQEYHRVINNGVYEKVVNIEPNTGMISYKPGRKTVFEEIFVPTYEIKFIVFLPL